jgi:hypothetical protein
MNLPHFAIVLLELLFGCAFLALVWWAINRMGVPEPVKTIILVIIGVFALCFLWAITIGGGINFK